MRRSIALLALLMLVGCGPAREEPSAPVVAPVSDEKGSSPAEVAERPPALEPEQPCIAVLATVKPAIGAEWVESGSGPCWIQWEEQATDYYLSLSWSKAEGEPWIDQLTTVPLAGGRYLGQLGFERLEKTGAPFWGPKGWALVVTGERGRVTVTCGRAMAPNLEQGRERQSEVDIRCPELLRQTAVGDIGAPIRPVAASQVIQDLWLVPPADLLAGRIGAGRHLALPSTLTNLQVSPDGRLLLLHRIDKSRSRTTYPVWIEVRELETGHQWRLTEQSGWWTAEWLPDGRVLLVGSSQAFVTDQTVRRLESLYETGARIGLAFDGKEQVAWASRLQTPTHDPTNEFSLRMLNLATGKVTEFPGRYHTRVSPRAGAPMALSPEGDRLALVDKVGEKGSLVILTLATSEENRFEVDRSADVAGWDSHGLWVRYQVGEDWQVGRFDAEGRELERFADLYPRISPDGQWAVTSRYTVPTETESMWAQPGLLNLTTGEVHWSPVTGYVVSGWAQTGELILLQEPIS